LELNCLSLILCVCLCVDGDYNCLLSAIKNISPEGTTERLMFLQRNHKELKLVVNAHILCLQAESQLKAVSLVRPQVFALYHTDALYRALTYVCFVETY